MAPPRGTKRRVSERSDYDPNDGRRPSPHHLSGVHNTSRYDTNQSPVSPTSQRGRGRGRGGRGGRAGRSNVGAGHQPSQAPLPDIGPNEQKTDARSRADDSTTQTITPPPPPAANIDGTTEQPEQPQPDATTSKTAANPPTTQTTSSRPVTPPPMVYEYLTDDQVNTWQECGRQDLIQQTLKVLAEANLTNLCSIVHELLRTSVDGRLDAAEVGDTIRVIIDQTPQETPLDVTEVFLDALSTVPGIDMGSPSFKTLCFSTRIPAEKMRLILESDALTALGLVQSSFSRMFIRKQTNILYKQSNYNLLREETEGYSKLITELFSVGQEPDPTSDTAYETFENMKALIGAFDLDAGRVLDVTLDVCASTVIKNHRFFVKLLRMSDYWPSQSGPDGLAAEGVEVSPLPLWAEPDHHDWRLTDEEASRMADLRKQRDEKFWAHARTAGIAAFFSLGRRKVLSDEERIQELEKLAAQTKDEKAKNLAQWISQTRTLPPSGSSVAAQLLGFKLRFYASSVRSETDVLPPSLIYLTAMLIKIGFISLLDIYPHLSPHDDSMESVKQKGLRERADREQAKRGGAAVNALTRAGALSDDTVPMPNTRLRNTTERGATPGEGRAETTRDRVKAEPAQADDVPDQKINLLKSLLCIGALPEALFLLGRFPWLLDVVSDLPKHIFRILHHCLSAVYDAASNSHHRAGVDTAALVPAEDQSGLPKGGLRLTDAPANRVLKWAQLDTRDAAEGIDYKFYWDEWADTIPVCQSVEDVFLLCNTLLSLVGVKIGQDAGLLTKLARIGNFSLDADPSAPNFDRWHDLLKRLLCPALSLTKANTSVVGEVFALLKRYSVSTRYNIYAEWFTGPTSRSGDVAEAFNLTRYETKDIMKKVNKLDSGPSSRKLAKASASAPGIVFDVFLRQLEQYDNLIDVVVDCGRHFTELSYDVLSWSILTFLGNEARGRVSNTGFTANKWLVSLSTFTGKILKKYSAMNVQPFILYILSQLRKNSYIDIRVLRDVIRQMSGVTALTDLTDGQMMALAGGDLLRSETLHQLQDERMNPPRAAKRLIASLIENNTGTALLIALAQQCERSIYSHDQDDNKILSEVYDEMNTVFQQCLDMTRANTSLEQFDQMIPDLVSLVSDYQLEVSTAFAIQRSSITRSMAEYDRKHGSPSKGSRAPSSEKRQSPENDASMDNVNGTVPELKATNEIVESAVDEASDTPQLPNGGPSPPSMIPPTSIARSCHPVLKELADRIEPTLSLSRCSYISTSFLVTFWQLSLSDLLAPTNIYEDEMKKALAKKAAIIPDRSDTSVASVKRREAEKIDESHDRLMKEMKAKMKHFQAVQSRLTREKDQWIEDPGSNWDALNHALLQDYFLPRLVLSPLDSYYAQKMLFFLHSKGTRNFRIMLLFDRLFDSHTISNLIYTCSGKEAENLGKFLAEVLKTLNEWHADPKEYERKAQGRHNSMNRTLPGFLIKTSSSGQSETLLDFEAFRNLLSKWHRKLAQGLQKCLDQLEYMHVKNAITVVTTIAPHYPVTKSIGEELLKKIQQVRDREQPAGEGEKPKPFARQDLWTSANSAQAPLKRRERHWILPQDFCTSKSKATPPSAINTSVHEIVRDPKQLDAKAPNFAPRASLTSNGIPMSAASVEDGEVKDTPMVDAPKAKMLFPEPKPTSRDQASQEPKSDIREPPSTQHKHADAITVSGEATKPEDTTVRPQASGVPSREDERILKQRAMESMKRRSGSDANRLARPSEQKDPQSAAMDASPGPTASTASQPATRNSATDQAPDGPRRERERPSRYQGYDSRNTTMQLENNHSPHVARAGPGQTHGGHYPADTSRSSIRPSDMSYGRLNADTTNSQSSTPSRPLVPSPTSGPARGYEHERRQGDGYGNMGPPPRREYSQVNNRTSSDQHRPVLDQRPNGAGTTTPGRQSGLNPERARLMNENAPTDSERRPTRSEPFNKPDPGRVPPAQPPSPRGPRYDSEHGASIRGQASMSSPNGRSAFPQGLPPQNTQGSSAPDSTGVHPSRMSQIQGTARPPPIQTSPQDPSRRALGGPGLPQSTAGVPSGPRSAGPQSAGSPTGFVPPSGPSSAASQNQYNRTDGSRRQFGRLQETLNQSNQAPRPPTNGIGPRNGPVNAGLPAPGAASRGYSTDGSSPPSSRGFDSRGPPPPPQFQARGPGPAVPPRERVGEAPPRDVRGAQFSRPEVSIPSQELAPAPYDRNVDRGPRRELRSDIREVRDRGMDRPVPHEVRFDRPERPPAGDTRQDRQENRDYRGLPRSEQPDLFARDGGPRRGAPRELMPEGPTGGRDGRDARLRESDRMRERSPRGEMRRDTREPRDYPKEYRDRREDARPQREDMRGARPDTGYGARGVRRDDRGAAPLPPPPRQHWREEPKRDFEKFDEDKRALRGRDPGGRPGPRR
ncbi:MAG: hypothetical protein Q9159_000624 [Coniocarpon cinnabarinum]